MTILPQRFFITRHAETTDNARGIASGRGSNPALTDEGVKQGRLLKKVYDLLTEELGKRPYPVVITTLHRTRATAKLMTGRDDFIVEPGMDERDLGKNDGRKTEEQLKESGPSWVEETRDAHGLRVVSGLNRQLDASADDATPMFVAHTGSIRRIFEAMGLPEKMEIPSAAMYECINIGGRWKVMELFVVPDLEGPEGAYKLEREEVLPDRSKSMGL